MIRLDKKVIESICQTFRQLFLLGDQLWIFGSRVKSEAKGGDIDLYIETSLNNSKEVLNKKLRFISTIETLIGEQKIDVIIKFNNYELPIYKIAKETGVRLV